MEHEDHDINEWRQSYSYKHGTCMIAFRWRPLHVVSVPGHLPSLTQIQSSNRRAGTSALFSLCHSNHSSEEAKAAKSKAIAGDQTNRRTGVCTSCDVRRRSRTRPSQVVVYPRHA